MAFNPYAVPQGNPALNAIAQTPALYEDYIKQQEEKLKQQQQAQFQQQVQENKLAEMEAAQLGRDRAEEARGSYSLGASGGQLEDVAERTPEQIQAYEQGLSGFSKKAKAEKAAMENAATTGVSDVIRGALTFNTALIKQGQGKVKVAGGVFEPKGKRGDKWVFEYDGDDDGTVEEVEFSQEDMSLAAADPSKVASIIEKRVLEQRALAGKQASDKEATKRARIGASARVQTAQIAASAKKAIEASKNLRTSIKRGGDKYDKTAFDYSRKILEEERKSIDRNIDSLHDRLNVGLGKKQRKPIDEELTKLKGRRTELSNELRKMRGFIDKFKGSEDKQEDGKAPQVKSSEDRYKSLSAKYQGTDYKHEFDKKSGKVILTVGGKRYAVPVEQFENALSKLK